MSMRTCPLRSLRRRPSRGMCAKLRRSLCGTRAAPARWRALCTETLESFGLAKGKAIACCFCNSELGVRCVVRGDGFTFAGYDADLDVAEKLMDEKFMCEVEGRLGGGPSDLQE
eukprot:9861030-Alexandrium_andersonii.AAC.1